MILYPSVDDLLEKVDSRYSLIMLASKRAHQLDEGAPKMLDSYKSTKNVGRALEEVVVGDVIIDPNEVDD
ncbi:DNA-directed RNA polymerase subunit omega [Pediococcus claussenii]|uniref:DNA-directed RNA polymerase subunit omega n=1 Tax=Pediococcus claussenii (strain ATCC BAA-344 / DSM 14800 / JCM 18046 / KCTC 3811 / LMG 21948 / P06) TaxID=701521 RepID=G8PDI7_PEDCP|nr:DNA-directed RNA polymerase subunit omega [Pediococcus claussenii]AEV95322.1 DNA-directed RNA polymerase, omega subunit [Pediococcus claussenii ATCC BAA-344]ANZ68855.1 DNA-directed RNA polymerase subunit omega [Pediococcus claussenii]ANZ70671.1 DNA-directed RNA polymerase subunit omega [Pediococcus claussenii]KRN19496.1 hypothetical protein IV79_GL001213 [Pediococcus claussenii]